jgi:hypothetical protein
MTMKNARLKPAIDTAHGDCKRCDMRSAALPVIRHHRDLLKIAEASSTQWMLPHPLKTSLVMCK